MQDNFASFFTYLLSMSIDVHHIFPELHSNQRKKLRFGGFGGFVWLVFCLFVCFNKNYFVFINSCRQRKGPI